MENFYIFLVYFHGKDEKFQLLPCTPIYTSLHCNNCIIMLGKDNVKYKNLYL